MSRYMRSPCCNAPVVVPVDVTVHLQVDAKGAVSNVLRDSMSGVRWSALRGDVDPAEAYCEECGASVAVDGTERDR